uniref:Annexin n=1 Tax=Oryza meridionalis TaxID=40149 RepID=A0A0E0DQX9_9ORYZ
MCCWCCCLDCIHNIPPLNLLFLHFSPHSLSSSAASAGGGEAAAVAPMASISVPNPAPSPTEDAESIRKAVQGWGTDENALIEILGHRTAAQRAEIAIAYEGLYDEALLDRLHSELSGDFRSALMLWTMDPAARDAKLANEALKKKKKGELRHIWVLVEVACASSPDHLVAVRKAYRAAYASSLEEDVASCAQFGDPLRRFLVRLVSSYRYVGGVGGGVDGELAIAETAELHDAVVGRGQALHGDVVRVVGTRSKAQVAATLERYRQEHGKGIDEVLDGRRGDQLAAVLKAALWCLTSPEKHFAEVIRTSILGLGTDEEMLTRGIVSRAEVDMEKVKEEYKVRYNTTVTADVRGDTSGYYMNTLLTLVGPEK